MPKPVERFIKIKVIPNSKVDAVKKYKGGFIVQVKVQAKQNQANQRALSLLKKSLGCQRIQLVSGQHKPNKIIKIL